MWRFEWTSDNKTSIFAAEKGFFFSRFWEDMLKSFVWCHMMLLYSCQSDLMGVIYGNWEWACTRVPFTTDWNSLTHTHISLSHLTFTKFLWIRRRVFGKFSLRANHSDIYSYIYECFMNETHCVWLCNEICITCIIYFLSVLLLVQCSSWASNWHTTAGQVYNWRRYVLSLSISKWITLIMIHQLDMYSCSMLWLK